MSSGIHRAVAGTHERSRFRNSDNLSATDTTFSCLALGGSPFPLTLPSSIEWMRGIERIAVDADRRAIALVFKRWLQAVMAGLAKRSDRAAKKGVIIAAMCWEVIRDRGRDDEALRLAKLAQRLGPQLMFRSRSPALQAVPRSRRKRLRWGEVASGHRSAS